MADLVVEHTFTIRKNPAVRIIKKGHPFFFYKLRDLNDGSTEYKCKECKTKNCKCRVIVLGNTVLKEINEHSHKADFASVNRQKARSMLAEAIKNAPDPFAVKPKKVYEWLVGEHPEVIFPPFESLKTAAYDAKNDGLPEGFDDKDNLPEEHELYKTKGDNPEPLCIVHDEIMAFQSPRMAETMYKYGNHLFIDGTFYSAPIDVYQIMVIRVYHDLLKKPFTVAFGLLEDKKLETYERFFSIINENVINFAKGKYKKDYVPFMPKIIHCDYEENISSAAKKIWKEIKVLYCYFHYVQTTRRWIEQNFHLDVKYNNEFEEATNNIIYSSHLPPDVFLPVVDYLGKEKYKDNPNVVKFYSYFRKEFLVKRNPEESNYYKIKDFRTNNINESYNYRIKTIFGKHPRLVRFMYYVQEEEAKLRRLVESLEEGWIAPKVKGTDKVDFQNFLDITEKENEKLGNKKADRKKRIENWAECALKIYHWINVNNKFL